MSENDNRKRGCKCWTCFNHYEVEDMAGSMICRTCYCADVSMQMTQASRGASKTYRMKSEKAKVSRFIQSQVKKMRCVECGERLFYGRDHFALGLRLLQLNCYGSNSHSMYALIDLRGKVTALYKSGTWFQENYRYVHPDIPF